MTHDPCPECGVTEYEKYNYRHLAEAIDRWQRTGRKQAQEILELKLKVMEIEDRDSHNNQKVRRQEKAIRKLEEKLRQARVRPYLPDAKP